MYCRVSGFFFFLCSEWCFNSLGCTITILNVCQLCCHPAQWYLVFFHFWCTIKHIKLLSFIFVPWALLFQMLISFFKQLQVLKSASWSHIFCLLQVLFCQLSDLRYEWIIGIPESHSVGNLKCSTIWFVKERKESFIAHKTGGIHSFLCYFYFWRPQKNKAQMLL